MKEGGGEGTYRLPIPPLVVVMPISAQPKEIQSIAAPSRHVQARCENPALAFVALVTWSPSLAVPPLVVSRIVCPCSDKIEPVGTPCCDGGERVECASLVKS